MIEGQFKDAENPDDMASIELITDNEGDHILEVRIQTKDVMKIMDFYDKIKDLIFGSMKR